MIDLDTVAGPRSCEAALHARRRRRLRGAERLLAGEARAAFCGLRPPGPPRRARRARWASACSTTSPSPRAHALAAVRRERVLILDWDVHHGNGTEAIFAASAEVLYASIHQWPLYPGTGAAEYAGEGEGEGYTVNLPVPAGRRQRGVPGAGRARGGADRARLSSRG